MAMAYVDTYGDNDFGGFVGIGMGATGSRQIVVPGANHNFEGDAAGVRLLETITQWLDTTDFRQ
jgi:hypothetical protein